MPEPLWFIHFIIISFIILRVYLKLRKETGDSTLFLCLKNDLNALKNTEFMKSATDFQFRVFLFLLFQSFVLLRVRFVFIRWLFLYRWFRIRKPILVFLIVRFRILRL